MICAVIGEQVHLVFTDVNPTTRLEGAILSVSISSLVGRRVKQVGDNVPISLPQEFRPIFDRTAEMSDVNHVKVILGPCPVAFGVIDLELNVWWDP